MKSKSRIFADVNSKMPKEYWDYSNYELKFGDQKKYQVIKKIGRGKYSEVFKGINIETNEYCAIKVLKAVRPDKIKRECLILENLKDGPNILKVYDIIDNKATQVPSLITEYFNNKDSVDFYPQLSDYDCRYYTYQLLRALEYTHSRGIMHRDVKPLNIMIDHERRVLSLIDWGLAEFYHPGTEYNVRVASRYYKGPELLVNFRYYDYSLDMWAVGCTLAEMIFNIHPLFKGDSNEDQLVKIAKVLGTDELWRYLSKYGLSINQRFRKQIGDRKRVSWNRYINKDNEHKVNPQALDLLDKLLKYDHDERLTVVEAMQHPYFDIVKEREGYT